MKCVLYTMADGFVKIGRIVQADGRFSHGIRQRMAAGMDEASAIASVVNRGTMAARAASWRVGDSSELPGGQSDGKYDNIYQHAFQDIGGSVVVDLPEARNIKEDRLNSARRLKIRELLEEEALGADVTAEKVAVAAIDARALVDAAKDVDELKAIDPPELRSALTRR